MHVWLFLTVLRACLLHGMRVYAHMHVFRMFFLIFVYIFACQYICAPGIHAFAHNRLYYLYAHIYIYFIIGNTYIHTYIHTHTKTYMCRCLSKLTQGPIHKHTYTHIYIHTYQSNGHFKPNLFVIVCYTFDQRYTHVTCTRYWFCMYVCMYVCMCTHVTLILYVCMYVCMCIHATCTRYWFCLSVCIQTESVPTASNLPIRITWSSCWSLLTRVLLVAANQGAAGRC